MLLTALILQEIVMFNKFPKEKAEDIKTTEFFILK